MANILLLANLNCDRILQLDKPLKTGGRFHYQDGGLRLGGGGANTGIGLVWAQHNVAIVSQVGSDDIGDWILAQAGGYGLDCRMVQRYSGNTCEMLLVMTPDGERTIIRSPRPQFALGKQPKWSRWDAFYVNSEAEAPAQWMNAAQKANPNCLVVAQLAADDRPLPCHVLIASLSDIKERCEGEFWAYGLSIAGPSLQYFIVTDGEHGAVAYTACNRFKVAAETAKVVDTTGAGDAYAAGLIHGLVSEPHCQQLSIEVVKIAMQQAAIWSSFAVASQSSIPGAGLQHFLDNEATGQ